MPRCSPSWTVGIDIRSAVASAVDKDDTSVRGMVVRFIVFVN
jgi:hypothetical protein